MIVSNLLQTLQRHLEFDFNCFQLTEHRAQRSPVESPCPHVTAGILDQWEIKYSYKDKGRSCWSVFYEMNTPTISLAETEQWVGGLQGFNVLCLAGWI